MRRVYEKQWVGDRYQDVLRLLELTADSVRYWGSADDFRRLHSACQNINTIKERFVRKAAWEESMKQHDKIIQKCSDAGKKGYNKALKQVNESRKKEGQV